MLHDSRLKGKKILLIGGTSTATLDMVRYAKGCGVYTIVADYLNDSPSKQLADESWLISTADTDELTKRGRNAGIDGVMAGVSEFNLEKAMVVCENLGLPFYATKQLYDLLTNKNAFKNLCQNFNIPVVKSYPINLHDLRGEYDWRFPVVVKPADSSGGRGVYICSVMDELLANYEKALTFSPGQEVIIEKYMDGEEVTIFYIVQEGEIVLTALADRYTQNHRKDLMPLPVAYMFPSKYLGIYQETLNDKVKAMFKSVGVKNGVIFIQAFMNNGDFVFYEMGFRLNGAMVYKILERIGGINPMEMMVSFALTGNMHQAATGMMVAPYAKEWACIISFSAKPGRIGKFIGLREIASIPEVIDVVPAYSEGDQVESSGLGTLKQVVLRVYAIAPTRQALRAVIERIYQLVRVLSESGEDLLLAQFDPKELDNARYDEYGY